VIHLRRRHRPIPVRRLVPSVLTTVALCSGMASLHFSLKQDWDRALAAIAVAAVFDVLDGRAARLLHATSRFGAVLDSLADFLSFGVAPALLLYQWQLKNSEWGLACVVTYVLCAALRLARFTARPRRTIGRSAAAGARYFEGMPSPAAAGAVLMPLMIFLAKSTAIVPSHWFVVPWTFLIALLMISRIPMYSIKAVHIRRYLAAPLMVAVGLFVVLAVKDAWLAAAVLSGLYVATIPISAFTARRPAAPAGEAAAAPALRRT
jgi:CDP-diacylglycerol--serine O-phosphatidyltransferase